jgi:hypothetical protein
MQDESARARAIEIYRAAFAADAQTMTDDEIAHEIIAGRLACPLCDRIDCDMTCERK